MGRSKFESSRTQIGRHEIIQALIDKGMSPASIAKALGKK